MFYFVLQNQIDDVALKSESLRDENVRLTSRVDRLEKTINLIRDALTPPEAPSPESEFIMTHVRDGEKERNYDDV